MRRKVCPKKVKIVLNRCDNPPIQKQPESLEQPSVSIEKHFSLHCMYICLCQRSVERKLYLLHGFLGQIIHVLAEPDGGSTDEDKRDSPLHDEDKEKGEVPKRQDFNVTMICNSRYFYMFHLAKDGNVEQIVDELKTEKERVCGKLLSIFLCMACIFAFVKDQLKESCIFCMDFLDRSSMFWQNQTVAS
jgi:hypothetical protein